MHECLSVFEMGDAESPVASRVKARAVRVKHQPRGMVDDAELQRQEAAAKRIAKQARAFARAAAAAEKAAAAKAAAEQEAEAAAPAAAEVEGLALNFSWRERK